MPPKVMQWEVHNIMFLQNLNWIKPLELTSNGQRKWQLEEQVKHKHHLKETGKSRIWDMLQVSLLVSSTSQ